MILLIAFQFLTDFVDFVLIFRFTIIKASQYRSIIDEVVREILMDSNSKNGDCLSDNDPDFDD